MGEDGKRDDVGALATVENLTSHFDMLRLPSPAKSGPSSKQSLQPVDENSGDMTAIIKVDGLSAFKRVGHKENDSHGRELRASALPAEVQSKITDPKVHRLVNASQIYFLDYYFDLMTYVYNRQQRLAKFKTSVEGLATSEQDKQFKSYAGRERAFLRKRRTRLRYGDFNILTQIGQGGYGQVFLARKSDTKEICALKVMSKKLLFKLDEIRHVLTERDILTAAKSPWLVKLLYAFQNPENIYLAMEYVPGGDYRTLLNNTGILSPRHARFYIAEMFCAIDSLHKLGYIHRDLKPENFLIDASGHIKLTDFGLSAGAISKERVESMRVKLDAVKNLKVTRRSASERQSLYRSLRGRDVNYANSIVGSPDYMALEVLEGKQYDFTIDYWSLGCMLFETLSGYPPFSGSTMDETYSNLRSWRDVLQRPVFDNNQYAISDRTWDLIKRLIAVPEKRLRSLNEVQRHAYFAETDLATIRQLQPPFIPQLDSDIDAGYFDDFSNQEDMAKYKEVHDKQAQLERIADRTDKLDRAAFVGFTFKHTKFPATFEDGTQSINKANWERSKRFDNSFGTIF
ncbi:kinase-like domain-containing protein [Dipodascopsis tothii]|uniref:kinase-like domain-containing protein n=1 Tax=Dipodascopsis tothii TaxID=44089 RepID=UPI0034CEC907